MEIDIIIKYSQRGDKKASELLVQKYYNELYYTALGIVHSGWDALDICQETFIQVFSSLHTLKDPSKFRSWINRILINKCNDFFRRNRKVFTIENLDIEAFIEEGREDQIDLLRALASLKEDLRIVLTLRYFQDLPIKEIASIVGCPEGTIKSRLSNGLQQLRRLMKKKI